MYRGGSMNVTDALKSLKPGAEWNCIGETYSGITWLDSSQTKPTESEVNAQITRLTNAEPMRLLRVERDAKLASCDRTQSRDVTLSNDVAWKTYRQALRDLPASANPTVDSDGNLNASSVTWPTKPS